MSKKLYRPPVVVVLGHVDHGKTTLLDTIRKSNLTSKEAGNITQSIGGYEVKVPVKGYQTDRLTFIDTPGHEAFTALRARGAHVADIAILIIDGTASVKPQTVESISHIQQANIPYVVAVNKTDLPTAQVDKVKKDLAKHKVLTEGLGGTVPVVPISAKKGDGISDLLEALLYIASESELTYDPNGALRAYVIEAHQEKAGSAASCIIKDGTLKVGDMVYAGSQQARVRALITDVGTSVKEVVPSMPFLLFGFKDIPEVGIHLRDTELSEDGKQRTEDGKQKTDNMSGFFKQDDAEKLKIILKVNTQGSLDSILPILGKNSNIEIIFNGVGEITKSDIFLAKVSEAIIIGFGQTTIKSVEKIAAEEKVVIKTYNIIYNLFEELQEVSQLLKEKDEKAKSLKGEAKVQAVFTIDDNKIAGIKVLKGRFDINDKIELYRNKKLKSESILISIKHRARSVQEAKKDQEAGLLLDPQLDIVVGDVVKSYSI